MKVQISLNDDLMAKIDDCAARMYMSRSGLISLACTEYLKQLSISDALVRLSLIGQKIADSGSLDAETKKQFDDLNQVIQFFTK